MGKLRDKLSSIGSVRKMIGSKAKGFRSQIPKEKEESLIIPKLPGYFLIAVLLVSLYYLFEILRPFISVIFLAIVLTVTFYPLYKWILKHVKKDWLASLLSCLAVILVIVIPIGAFVIMLANEASDTYQLVRTQVESGAFDKYLQWEEGGYFYDIKQSIEPFVDINTIDVKDTIVNGAQNLSTFIFDQTANLLKSVSTLVLHFVIMLFSMFYFFRDGERLVKRIGFLSPLPKIYESELVRKLDSMVKAIMLGVFLTAIVQGVVAGVGYTIAGISNPIFWGAAIAFFSLVPVVGTAAVWLPTGLVLLAMGDYGSAIFIFIWGMFVVGSVDNFLRPYLIGGKAQTYPLMTFFVVLGGIFTMGLKGIIVGPLVLMVVMSLLHIYEIEYRKVLKK